MAIQLKQLVPYLLLLSIFSVSHGKEKPCKCSDSDQDRKSYHTFDDAGYAFRLIDREAGVVRRAGINILSNDSAVYQNNTGVLSTINRWIKLWQDHPDGLGVDEASFSVSIVYQPTPDPEVYSGLTFLIIPAEMLENVDHPNSSLAKELLAIDDDQHLQLSHPITRTAPVLGAYVSVMIGMLELNRAPGGPDDETEISIVGVKFSITPTTGVGNRTAAYKVWIDYDRVSLSVYLDMENKSKPVDAIADQKLSISSVLSRYLSFNLVATSSKLLSRTSIDFRATVEDLPRYYGDKGNFMSRKMTILSSVLGPVAVTAVVAAGVAWYFNSRYRRWQKDLDQLARSMERLPGVPTKVDFADINKATGYFNENMKLGGGGFGTVYRCTLSAAACKMDRPMDVAVKRFTRDVQNHRYDDFLAEVSIINRLRHKNIVPLMGEYLT
jgi:interleukin-1 receptor-associated kinase 1